MARSSNIWVMRNGEKVKFTVPFRPTLFVTNKGNNAHDWNSLDGNSVEPIVFGSMGEATDFIKVICRCTKL